MEFGLDQLRTGLQPDSSRFELRAWSQTGSQLVYKPNSITLSWSQSGIWLLTKAAACTVPLRRTGCIQGGALAVYRVAQKTGPLDAVSQKGVRYFTR